MGRGGREAAEGLRVDHGHKIQWRCGEVVFLKPNFHWVDPKWGFRLGYVYGTKAEIEKRLAQVKKGAP